MNSLDELLEKLEDINKILKYNINDLEINNELNNIEKSINNINLVLKKYNIDHIYENIIIENKKQKIIMKKLLPHYLFLTNTDSLNN